MNTITINFTGQLTLDPKNLEQLFSGLQIQAPPPAPMPPPQPAPTPAPTELKSLPRLAYSVKETAEMLGISEKSVHRLLDRGLLKCSLALRHKRIPRAEIERFLRAGTGD